MPAVVLDLVGDDRWGQLRIAYVSLAHTAFWSESGREDPVVIDCRGRHEEGVALLACLPSTVKVRGLITDRETPDDHKSAYLAGATKIVVADPRHEQLEELISAFLEE